MEQNSECLSCPQADSKEYCLACRVVKSCAAHIEPMLKSPLTDELLILIKMMRRIANLEYARGKKDGYREARKEHSACLSSLFGTNKLE